MVRYSTRLNEFEIIKYLGRINNYNGVALMSARLYDSVIV